MLDTISFPPFNLLICTFRRFFCWNRRHQFHISSQARAFNGRITDRNFTPYVSLHLIGYVANALIAAEPADTSPPEEIEAGQAEAETNAMLRQNTMALELQLEERPLAKRQTELLQSSEEPTSAGPSSEQVEIAPKDPEVPSPPEDSQKHEEHKHERKALLKNDDHELERVSKVRNC